MAYLIMQDLRRKPRRRRRLTSAKPGDKRVAYNIAVPLAIPDRRELEARAREEMRSMSGYVARLILEDLRT